MELVESRYHRAATPILPSASLHITLVEAIPRFEKAESQHSSVASNPADVSPNLDKYDTCITGVRLEPDLRDYFCESEMGAKARENTLSEMAALYCPLLYFFVFCAPCSLRDENADPIDNGFTVSGAIIGRHIPWAETLSARTTNPVITSTSSYNVDQGTPTRNGARLSERPPYPVDRARGAAAARRVKQQNAMQNLASANAHDLSVLVV